MTYRKSKRAISFMLVMAMLMTLLVGTTAWFTDRVSTSASGTAGTVTINLDDSGINLKDSDGKDILNPGDMRNVSYVVSNTGNKSVDIKETIYLSAYDKLGQALNLSDTQSEFEIYNASDVSFVDNRGYLPNDGAEPLQVKSLSENVITYEIPVYALNGSTNFDDSNREIEDDITTDKHSSDYVLVFKNLAGNAFQGAVLKLDLMVEAKQHRNTENVLWTEVATRTHVLSNGNTVYIVPGAGVVINPSEDFEVEDLGNGNIKISGLTDIGANKETLVIPSTIVDGESGNTYTVTDVDWEQVFADSNNTKINNSADGLPQPEDELVFDMTSDGNTTTITGINANGNKLTDISIPEQVGGEDVEISDSMVEDMTNSDANVEIPDSVMENLPATAIYTYTTDDATGDVTITGLTEIGMLAQTLDIPSEMAGSSVIKIDKYALLHTTATEVIIPETIQEAAFAFAAYNISSGINTTIKTVTINAPIVSPNIFMGASALETVNINASVDTIGGAAFLECKNLKNINIDEGITSIESRAFEGCTSLTNINFPESLQNIGHQAFLNSGLTGTVNIPSGMTTIGRKAFEGTAVNTVNLNVTDSFVIGTYYGTGSSWEGSYITEINYINPEMTVLPDYAFADATMLTSFSFPDSVTTIPAYAFRGCSSLTEINIPEGITKINNDAFAGTTVKTVGLPSTLTTFGDNVFIGSSIEYITIPAGVAELSGTFKNVKTLKTVTFEGDTLPVISTHSYWGAFGGCTGVTDIYISDTVTSIQSDAFMHLASNENLTIHYAGSAEGSPWGATNATVVAD